MCIRLINPHADTIFCMLYALLVSKYQLAAEVGAIRNISMVPSRLNHHIKGLHSKEYAVVSACGIPLRSAAPRRLKESCENFETAHQQYLICIAQMIHTGLLCTDANLHLYILHRMLPSRGHAGHKHLSRSCCKPRLAGPPHVDKEHEDPNSAQSYVMPVLRVVCNTINLSHELVLAAQEIAK